VVDECHRRRHGRAERRQRGVRYGKCVSDELYEVNTRF
jgi:hypothetical protein